MVRRPAVAGQFYPGNPQRLLEAVDSCLEPVAVKQKALGILCPHAGYPYSGPTAGKVVSRVAIPRHVILLGVNHHGIGGPFALCARGQWQTPLGAVDVDEPLAEKLLSACPHLEDDPGAHEYEHSLEVELPFLQRTRKDLQIVPIAFGNDNPSRLSAIGKAIATVIKSVADPILLLSSSDMNHFESQEVADRKDRMAIEAMLALDPERLLEVCDEERITMCGVAPTCAMLHAVNALGGTRAELVDHRTSGEVTGDYSSVVGYAGIIFS